MKPKANIPRNNHYSNILVPNIPTFHLSTPWKYNLTFKLTQLCRLKDVIKKTDVFILDFYKYNFKETYQGSNLVVNLLKKYCT